MNYAQIRPAGAVVGPTVDISKLKHRLLPNYHRLRKVDTPYVVNFGGGGSGKSYATAQSLVKDLFQQKHKLLVIRKFATSLNDSVISQFVDDALPFWGMKDGVDYKLNKTNKTLTTANGSKVLFRGLDNPEKFKSINGITIVWIEEATEISEKEFKILSDRIRGNPQIILSYNPISERHWLRKRFHHPDDPLKGLDDRITVLFSTYHENPFVGKKYEDDMEWYRINDPDHYRIYGQGAFGLVRPENPFFTAYKATMVQGEPEYDPAYPIYISADFNVKNTFLISQHYEGQEINYLEVIHGEGDLEQMCNLVAQRYGHGPIYWTGDASGNNASAYTTGNRSAWELIEMYMTAAQAWLCDYAAVPTSNPSLATNRHNCNALMTFYGKRMQIHRVKCGLLLDDLERMEANWDGSLNKTDCIRNNYGHAGDTFRYDLSHFEFSTYQQIGIHKKHA